MRDAAYVGQRLRDHDRRARRLSELTDDELGSLLAFDRTRPLLWGGACTFELGGEAIFAKRIPLTSMELARVGATDNHHALPLVYHYGVGSRGFGAWRELAITRRLVDWARDGLSAPFPLLAHHRVLAIPAGQSRMTAPALAEYVRTWNDDANVQRLAVEREQATQSLILCFEHVPHTLRAWLDAHQSRTGPVLDSVLRAFGILRDQGILHLDAHFENVLIDNDERVYVADFGLAIDGRFDLSQDERAFHEAHRRAHYDAGEVLACIPIVLSGQYLSLDAGDKARFAALCGLPAGELNFYALSAAIGRHLEALRDAGLFRVDRALIEAFAPYREIASHMLDFYAALSSDDAKTARLDLNRLRALLTAAGVLASKS
jgi:hypothetical protein